MPVAVPGLANWSYFLLITTVHLFYSNIYSQNIDKLGEAPLEYTIVKADGKIQIDGIDNENTWNRAFWTENFSDIESGERGPGEETRLKMLWDDKYLYIYIQLEEAHIWGSFIDKDDPVFHDDAFEMFIDPDGDAHNYIEFQINALGTVWDLFMPKPYRNGGQALSSWDIKGLKKAVVLNGTLNDATDQDSSWNIELAIPFKSIILNDRDHPSKDSLWRMQFARVDWETENREENYVRKKNPETKKLFSEKYKVWSPVGIVNLHYPERWGYVLFSEEQKKIKHVLSNDFEKHKTLVWKYFYLQQAFFKKTGKYANSIQELNNFYPYLVHLKQDNSKIKMNGSEHHFWVKYVVPSLQVNIFINEEGRLRIIEI